MQIIINGETRPLEGNISVDSLVDQLKLDSRKIAVEVNLQIIPKSQYQSTLINEGDRVEIVHFIAGG